MSSFSSSDTMYPPPGSCKYHTPKPIRNGSIHNETADDINCDNLALFVKWCLGSPWFRVRFWKLALLLALVITTGYFSSVLIFNRIEEPLFVLKNDFPFLKLNDTNQRNQESYQQRKIAYLWFQQPTIKENLNIFNQTVTPRPLQRFKHIKNKTLLQREGKRNLSFNSHSIKKIKKEFNKFVQKFGSRELVYNSSEPLVLNSSLKLCPPIPPNLEGPIKVELSNVPPLEVQEKSHPELLPGGRYRPSECKARHKVAIVIPFRDRAAHLAVFLYNIHPFLQKQQIDYAIYIVEQAGSGKFNRAMALNVGFLEALKIYPYDCFIFHDIDLIPEDDRNLYTCPVQPRHMSVAINTMQYKLPYNDIFGGVSAMTVDQFQTVNGFSNKFWGWGGEDDDMSNRIKYHGFYISRYPANIARYKMISHKKNSPNPQRFRVLSEGKKRFTKDGLSSVSYKVLDIKLKNLFTWIYVDLIKT